MTTKAKYILNMFFIKPIFNRHRSLFALARLALRTPPTFIALCLASDPSARLHNQKGNDGSRYHSTFHALGGLDL
jgi:hypothetical protein